MRNLTDCPTPTDSVAGTIAKRSTPPLPATPTSTVLAGALTAASVLAVAIALFACRLTALRSALALGIAARDDVKYADWSPDGTQLAIIRSVDGIDRLEYPIGTVLVQPAAGEGSGLGFVRISPDGQRVAFVHYRSPESLAGRVAVVDRAGKVTTLTDDYANIHGLAWKGSEIWYTAADDALLFRAFLAVTLEGAKRTVMRVPTNVTLWDALPDGRVVFAQTDITGSWPRGCLAR